MADLPRLYDFGTVFNFRDFGGYPTKSGEQVVMGKLFRAAHLNRVSDTELTRIAELGIDLVVDLRYRPERERQPNRFWNGGPARHLEFAPVDQSVVHAVAPHESFVENELETGDDARRYMMGSYSRRPHDAGFQAIFGQTLHHMVETGDPILIHCAAGKDRTGTLAALILHALGVDNQTIMDDFMLTMTAVDVEALLEPAAQMMSERHGKTLTPDAIRPMFGVEEAYLQAAIDAMGNVTDYLESQLKIGPAERDRLKANYLG